MKTTTIRILDYSEYPGPRYSVQGLDSGEDYYHTILKDKFSNALEKGEILIIDLDNTAGYAPSFIDEIFGNLVYDFKYDLINKHLEIKSEDEPDWKELITDNILPKWLQKRKDNQPRKPLGF